MSQFDPIFSDNGINQALSQNQAMGQQQAAQKPKFDLGKFLLAWAGNLGDNLTGNPVYASSVQNQQQAEAEAEKEERQRREQQQWWYEQKRYEQANQQRDVPGIYDELDEGKRRGELPQDMTILQYMQYARPGQFSPQMIPHGYEQVPGTGGDAPAPAGGGDNIPTLTSPEQAAGLPPGSRFKTPDGRIKIVPGGQTGSPPSGGFPPSY